jgi:hypothetical protein
MLPSSRAAPERLPIAVFWRRPTLGKEGTRLKRMLASRERGRGKRHPTAVKREPARHARKRREGLGDVRWRARAVARDAAPLVPCEPRAGGHHRPVLGSRGAEEPRSEGVAIVSSSGFRPEGSDAAAAVAALKPLGRSSAPAGRCGLGAHRTHRPAQGPPRCCTAWCRTSSGGTRERRRGPVRRSPSDGRRQRRGRPGRPRATPRATGDAPPLCARPEHSARRRRHRARRPRPGRGPRAPRRLQLVSRDRGRRDSPLADRDGQAATTRTRPPTWPRPRGSRCSAKSSCPAARQARSTSGARSRADAPNAA